MWRAVTRGTRTRLAVLGLAGAVAAMAVSTTGCSLLSGGGGADPGTSGRPKIEMGADGHVKGAIATATTPYQGYKVQVDVVSLTRYDKVTRLVFVVKPLSAGADTTDDLDGTTFGGDSLSGGNLTGVELLDTKNLKDYVPLTAGSGDKTYCACSTIDSSSGFPLDQPTTLYADYPAVPDSVDEVTVVLPKVGPIPHVKVSS